MKIILILILSIQVFGCDEKKSIPSCLDYNKNVKCSDFLDVLNIENLTFQGCEKGNFHSIKTVNAIYLVKEKHILTVEKKLINLANMDKVSHLNDIQMTAKIERGQFCIDENKISLYVYLKINSLSSPKDYKIVATIFLEKF